MDSARTHPRRWALSLLVVLAGLAAIYVVAGVVALGWNTGRSYPIDLRLRWTETRLLLAGINPQTVGHPDPELDAAHAVMQNLGGSYPPWAYATGILLAPDLPWTWTRRYAALLNLIALAVLALWSYRHARRFGPPLGAVAAASVLAIFPAAICISYGQYSVIVAASLAGAELLLDDPRPGTRALAGVLMGIACVKPQLGGLFIIAIVIERQWVALATCTAYLAVASGVTSWLAGANVVTMCLTSLKEASAFSFLSHNILVHWARGVLPFQVATLLLMAAGTAIALALLVASRRETRLVRWSICAVVAMFWAYRKHYDAPLMAFLVIALLLKIVRTHGAAAWVAFLVVGATLWLPLRDAQWDRTLVQVLDVVVWIAGLAVLLSRSGRAAGPGVT